MQYYTVLFNSLLFKIVANILIFVGWLVIAGLLLFFILHTTYALGGKMRVYKKPPLDGWNKRFYPACIATIGVVLLTMWALTYLQ